MTPRATVALLNWNGGDFARTVGNVRRLFAEKRARKSPLRVVVQMIVSVHNQHEIADFAQRVAGDAVLFTASSYRQWLSKSTGATEGHWTALAASFGL